MKLLLTNVVWDNTYKETRYFENVNVRNEWFGLPDSLDDRQVNFNVGGDLLASCVINNSGSNLVRLNYNYLVVEDTANNDYLFYFINSCKYLNAQQIQYNLELDVITQYLPTIENLPSHIFTAHVDRFKTPIPNEQLVYFDTGYQSKIWLEDIPNLAKRLKKKIPIKWKYTNNDLVDEWLNENVLCWLYVFISKGNYTRTYQKYGGGDDQHYRANGISYIFENDNKLFGDYNYIALPIYKKSNKIAYYHDRDVFNPVLYYFDMKALDVFRENNNDDSKVFSYVISNIPPLSSLKYIQDVYGLEIYNNDLVFKYDVNPVYWADNGIYNPNETPPTITGSGVPSQYYTFVQRNVLNTPQPEDTNIYPLFTGVALYNTQIKSYPIYTNELLYTTLFDKDFVKGFNFDDFIAEPKLSKMSAKEMQITSSFGNNFTFDGLKVLNDKQYIEFSLYSPITPGSNASLIRPVFTDIYDGVYQTAYNNEIIGLITNYDSTLPFAINQLATYLSNNKNFFIQRALRVGVNFGSAIGNAYTGNYGGAVEDLISGVTKGIETKLTVDNMRNAPETYKDSASNILLDLSILTDFGYYLEIWDALDIDKKIYLDNINHYGYILNIEDDMTKYFHTRKYFNYIRGEIHNISNNLSNVVKNKLKYIFNNGIRLFHRDDFNDPYTQNYELSLED